MASLRPDTLSWTALLARWVEFAQASVAMPDDLDGTRWRDAASSVIALQATTFALRDLEQVPPADRAVARDRAAVLIDEHTGRLSDLWASLPMPESLLELGEDARVAHAASAYVGAEELIWAGPDPMIMPEVGDFLALGTLAVMMPGTIVMPGEPVAWWVEHPGVEIAGTVAQPVMVPRQVYRQLDDNGRFTRDVIASVEDDLHPGMPLLVPLLEQGHRLGHFPMEAADWHQRQQAAMPGPTIPVVEAGSEQENDAS